MKLKHAFNEILIIYILSSCDCLRNLRTTFAPLGGDRSYKMKHISDKELHIKPWDGGFLACF